MKYYIGVDCGLDGGISILNTDGDLVSRKIMPTASKGKGRKIDVCGLADLFSRIGDLEHRQTFIIENPGGHAPSAAGLRSMTYSYAVIEALVVANGLKYHDILSQKWQKQFWSKPKMPKGQKFDTKGAALDVARKLWPKESWLKTDRCTKPHDGMVDAALLAEYGRRNNL